MLPHVPLLEAVAAEQKPALISTGMSTYEDIGTAVEIFRDRDCPFVLMHCVSEYPLAESSVNLRSIVELRRRYDCPVGYSGHEVTMIPGTLAAMMGAVVVERHISLDRAMYGSDQSASLERRGPEMMVDYIRTIPMIMGDGVKKVSDAELTNAAKLRHW
jgi:N-acetylneuraminate synthase